MKLIQRTIAWLFFLGFLAAVGVGVFHFVRYQPKCTIEALHENLSVLHLSDDGRKLVVCRWPADRGDQPKKPEERAFQPRLEVVDTASGRVVYTAENFATEMGNGGFEIYRSPDRRYFAGNRTKDTLLVDWQNEQSWPIGAPTRNLVTEIGKDGPAREVELIDFTRGDHRSTPWKFSPQGRWLVFAGGNVIDVSTRRFVRGFAELLGFIQSDRLAVFRGSLGKIILWDMENNCLGASLGSSIDVHSSATMLASDDGRWLVVADRNDQIAQAPGPGEIACSYAEVWDLSTKRRKLQIGGEGRQVWHAILSRKGSRLAIWTENEENCEVSLIDLDADDERLIMPMQQPLLIKHQAKDNIIRTMHWGRFSRTGKLFALGWQRPQPNEGAIIAVIDAASQRILWETRDYLSLDFSNDEESVYGANMGMVSEKHDARTGTHQGPAVWPQGMVLLQGEPNDTSCHAMPVDARLTLNGRYAASVNDDARLPEGAFWEWLRDHLPDWCLPREFFLVVTDTETRRELYRVGIDDSEQILLSEDGSTLVSTYTIDPDSTTVQIWDVHPHQAWLWAVTWSVATGMGLLLLRRWRVKRKATR